MGRAQIAIPHDKIGEFCRRHHIRRLSLFGSVIRDDFRPANDVDVLVEFEDGFVPGLIRFSGMELELGDILGHKVDLRTPEDLSRYFRNEVVESAEALYAE
ncbi:MAG: nucleotidyltransferase family protein [Deltaproteobacteria bacterium]|nr:nucleotidyltransferase family protein [Deltaproteobacteria bacterium]